MPVAPPPPPRRSGPSATLILVCCFAALTSLASAAVAIVAIVSRPEAPASSSDFSMVDELPFGEPEYLVESLDVESATRAACENLQRQAEAISLLPGSDPVGAVSAVIDAVSAIEVAVADTGADDDATRQWRDDLGSLGRLLVEARDDLAAGREPDPDLAADGDLAYRMSMGSPVGCEVPVRVLALDRDYPLVGDPSSFAASDVIDLS